MIPFLIPLARGPMRRLLRSSALVGSLVVCSLAGTTIGRAAVFDAQGNQIPDLQAGDGQVDWVDVLPGTGYGGVGVLGIAPIGDVCTASLVDTGTDTGPAYILTNAHCNYFEDLGANPLGPTEYRVHQATSYYVTFNHFVSVPESQRVEYPLSELTYITEFDTDVAIYELGATLGELRARGFIPLPFVTQDPNVGETVTLVGVPLLYVPLGEMSLHKSDCPVGATVELLNGMYHAPFSVIHKCSSLPGFSGGPLLTQDFHIALLNSHGTDQTIPNIPDCTYESRPCEILSDGGEVVHPERNYAQQVAGFGRCFDGTGTFDLGQAGCTLPGGPAAPSTDGATPSPDGGTTTGCGCSAAGASASGGAGLLWGALAIGFARRRRRCMTKRIQGR
jgi:MYXO-CTERM domain-containing protein